LYQLHGRKALVTLGRYPETTLKQALAEHGDARKAAHKGIDPAKARADAKAEFKEAPTVVGLLEEWKRVHLDKLRSGAETYRALNKDAVPKIGRLKARDVTRRDVVTLLDPIRRRAPRSADSLHGELVRLFNFGIERGVLSANPLLG